MVFFTLYVLVALCSVSNKPFTSHVETPICDFIRTNRRTNKRSIQMIIMQRIMEKIAINRYFNAKWAICAKGIRGMRTFYTQHKWILPVHRSKLLTVLWPLSSLSLCFSFCSSLASSSASTHMLPATDAATTAAAADRIHINLFCSLSSNT